MDILILHTRWGSLALCLLQVTDHHGKWNHTCIIYTYDSLEFLNRKKKQITKTILIIIKHWSFKDKQIELSFFFLINLTLKMSHYTFIYGMRSIN
jgi:hypothetical protein